MIHFDQLEFDLGELTYGQQGTAIAKVTNNGSEPVKLSVTNSSCSCTTGHIEYSVLQPGTSGKFTITLNTQKAGRGRQGKSINLSYTIGTTTNSQVFRIKVNVI